MQTVGKSIYIAKFYLVGSLYPWKLDWVIMDFSRHAAKTQKARLLNPGRKCEYHKNSLHNNFLWQQMKLWYNYKCINRFVYNILAIQESPRGREDRDLIWNHTSWKNSNCLVIWNITQFPLHSRFSLPVPYTHV